MRSDKFRAAMRQQLRLFAFRVLLIACIGVAVVLAALSTSCTRTFVPSGRPGCPNATVWIDSAQRCIAREGR